MVSVRHLSFRFGKRWALKNVSFTVSKGDFVFLTGPSGAGKTTLLRLLHGALAWQQGQASVCGFNLAAMRRSRLHLLRRQVAVVFQDFKILPERTVFENVILPLDVRGMPRMKSERRVRAALHALRLENLSHTPCAELAGGEKQRVAIARAVVPGPQLILADEPTGNLDWKLACRLMDVFRQFNAHGTTFIVATHNREIVEAVPEAVTLHLEGGEVDEGRYDVGEGCYDENEAPGTSGTSGNGEDRA